MSTFQLKIEYPDINYDWYQQNTNGTAQCPANWIFYGDDNIERYNEVQNGWILNLFYEESVKIPVKTYEVDFETHTLTFKHICYNDLTGEKPFQLKIYYNLDDYETIDFDSTGSLEVTVLTIPENTEYVIIEVVTSGVTLDLYVDIEFDFSTSWFDINTELANFSTSNNNKVSATIDNTLIVTSLGKRDISYTNNQTQLPEETKELDSLCDLALLNNFTVVLYVDSVELGGDSLGGMPTAGTGNLIKYYYQNHSSTEKTGLYKYLTIQYKNDVNNNYIL